MAYQTVKKGYQTFNGVVYDLQYDTSNGDVQLIQQNAPTGTKPIFSNGNWDSTLASQANIPSATQKTVYNDIQGIVQQTYTNAGGKSKGLVIPPWAANGNDGSDPGQTNPKPASQPSSNSGSTGGGFGDLFGAITNPPETFSNVSITNGEYGSVDSIFGGKDSYYKYPTDMQIKYQDYIHISMYKYNPPAAKTLLSGDYQSIINQGFQKDLNYQKSELLGNVYLPMPNALTDRMSAGWDGDSFNNLEAATLSHAMNNVPAYGAAFLGGALLNKATGGGGMQGGQFGIKALQAGAYAGAITGSGATKEGKAAVTSAALEQLLSQGFFGVDADSILARTAGIVANNNLELMFQGPSLRAFTLSYKMTARDSKEAEVIRKILRFFKQGSRPKKKNGGAGQASYFLATPNVFKVKFCLGGGKENPSVSRYKTCALKGVDVNYTAAGPVWAAYEDGHPLAVDMTLEFAELEPIFDTDYSEDIFQDFQGAIDAVSSDSVGY